MKENKKEKEKCFTTVDSGYQNVFMGRLKAQTAQTKIPTASQITSRLQN
jgi:hypothetical protein